jgi:hypothetical protein
MKLAELLAREKDLAKSIADKRAANAQAVLAGQEPDVDGLSRLEQTLRSVVEARQIAEKQAERDAIAAAADKLRASADTIQGLEEKRLGHIGEMEAALRLFVSGFKEHDHLAARIIEIASGEPALLPLVRDYTPDVARERTDPRIAEMLADVLREGMKGSHLGHLDLAARLDGPTRERRQGKSWAQLEREATRGFLEVVRRAAALDRAA